MLQCVKFGQNLKGMNTLSGEATLTKMFIFILKRDLL